MSNSDVARRAFELLEAKDFDGAAALMTDDFTFDGPVPEPVDRDGFLGLQRAVAVAFPTGRSTPATSPNGAAP